MTSLPTNATLESFSAAASWEEIERQKRIFNRELAALQADERAGDELPLEQLSSRIGARVRLLYSEAEAPNGANVVLADLNGVSYVLGSVVSKRYRKGESFLHGVQPYNLNPSVNHRNIAETEDSMTHMRVLGAEIEMGLVHPDGHSPDENEVQAFMRAYSVHAQRIGIYPRLDREACMYQVEAHIAPSVGYAKTRSALNGMMTALARTSAETGLLTAILPSYPTETDFRVTDQPKVLTAADLMDEVNGLFPAYRTHLAETIARYHADPDAHYINMFRNQGTHIHIDIAGRSEALGLLIFHTSLKSATTIANGAVLKGSPFVNGTCDPELLCTREYLRSVTATGRYLDLPLSPHLMPDGLARYGDLLRLERANSTGRATMYDDSLGLPISVMHNPVGRIRPDLGTSKRVCTVESTGMPTNISASRMAAVLVDYEFSHTLMEMYFRKYGCDLGPMHDDRTLWAILGPLDQATYQANQDASDRACSDVVLTTAAGTSMHLSEFYELKRQYMQAALEEVPDITPRDIDEVYGSLIRMLNPVTKHRASTIEQYINDAKLRSTGNWGQILRDAYVDAGGVIGAHCPDAVLRVVHQMNDAMRVRYLDA